MESQARRTNVLPSSGTWGRTHSYSTLKIHLFAKKHCGWFNHDIYAEPDLPELVRNWWMDP